MDVLTDELADDVIAFVVYGAPAQQGSKTARTSKAGATYMHEGNRAQLEPWRASVAAAATAAMRGRAPLDGPLELDVAFMFGRPRAHFRTGRHAGELKPSAPIYRDQTPDLDKLVRAIGDALKGIAIVDDSSVVELRARKCYGSPGAHVAIRRLT